MAQSTERTFGTDGAHWTGNIADVTRAYKTHIETIVKIQGFLARHAADVSFDLQQALYLETLETELKDGFVTLHWRRRGTPRKSTLWTNAFSRR